MQKKKNKLKDKFLSLDRSPLADDLFKRWEEESPESIKVEAHLNDRKTSMAGRLELGAHGHPVTILIMDEVSGAEMEFNHVRSALIVVEEKRKGSAGWLSMMVGNVEKIKPVLEMIAQATLDELKRLVRRD